MGGIDWLALTRPNQRGPRTRPQSRAKLKNDTFEMQLFSRRPITLVGYVLRLDTLLKRGVRPCREALAEPCLRLCDSARPRRATNEMQAIDFQSTST